LTDTAARIKETMKKIVLTTTAFFFLNVLICSSTYSKNTQLTLNSTPVQVCFSPSGCTEAIIKEITNARFEILIQAYSFTSAPIAKALLTAHKRSIKVEAILDKSQRREKYTSATFFVNAGIPTFIDDKHAIAHDKIMIIDRETVITGSFNFTKAAEEKNAENLLIIRNKDLAKTYLDNWMKHREHSEPYER
jgi:phosphatidylserine/phosphatidylglycerophosphate/cardiolipin synthase-like enzyme